MNVVIVILTYNSAAVIVDCLKSLGRKYPIIIVDSQSTDKTREIVEKDYKYIQFVPLNENVGYARGNNIGIDIALAKNPDYILILNPDVILDKNCIKELLLHTQTHIQPRIVGPKIFMNSSRSAHQLASNNSILWSAGGELDKKRYSSRLIGFGQNDEGRYDMDREVRYISGTCMLIPKQILETGLRFYEPYFMYYEDVDLCMQAKKAGYPAYLAPQAQIVHLETSSHNMHKNYYLARNHLLFVVRNAPYTIQLRELLRLPKTIYEHLRQRDFASLQGIRDYFLQKFGKCSSIASEVLPSTDK